MSDELRSKEWKRRTFLKAGAGALGAFTFAATAQAECQGLTPPQTMGPFYPVEDQDDKNWDLTQVAGRTTPAQGEQIWVAGTVTDQDCTPVSGALVEIWQACASGKYNHPGDTTTAPLDPDFQYWGQALTGADGSYRFKTILPGDYPASPTWQRPPHIHYRIQKRGFRELVTQMYFANHPLNESDFILQDIPAEERDRVIARLELPSDDLDLPTHRFDLTLAEFRQR